jgi:type IV secretory pathway TrbL component
MSEWPELDRIMNREPRPASFESIQQAIYISAMVIVLVLTWIL